MRRVAAAVVIALAALVLGCGEAPEAAYAKIAALAGRGDWGAVYDRIDKRSQGRLEATLAREPWARPGEPGRELFAHAARLNDAIGDAIPEGHQIAGVETRGDEATLRLRPPGRGDEGAGERVVHMLREDGAWKLVIEPPAPLPSQPPPGPPAPDPRAIECGRLLDVMGRGLDSLKRARQGGDPIATLGAMAKALDDTGIEAAKLELSTPELAAAARDYKDMAQAAAQSARHMASAAKAGDEARADAAGREFEAAAAREKPIVESVHRFCAALR